MGVSLRLTGGSTNIFSIASIGGAMSSAVITTAELNNIFDDVNRVEVINGRTEYRCFAIINDGATAYLKARLISLIIPADTEIAFAVDDATTPQLLSTEDSTPVGLSFLQFSEWNDLKVPMGTLDVGDVMFIWLRRKVTVGSDLTRAINFTINGIDNVLTPTGDFNSIENSHDNHAITTRSSQFFKDEDFMGEALMS